MDYPVSVSPPNIVPGMAVGYLDGNGTFVPVDASHPLAVSPSRDYQAVAAGQSARILGTTGATGDVLAGLLIVPASVSPGAVSIADGGGTAITLFTGGSNSVGSLVPFFVPVGARSISGAWKLTTGASVSVVAMGAFT